jgi:tRNA(Ile)-lysidine synthase TilS/MesJ
VSETVHELVRKTEEKLKEKEEEKKKKNYSAAVSGGADLASLLSKAKTKAAEGGGDPVKQKQG